MKNLVEFLMARLDEDEHFARRTHSSEWTFDELGQLLVNQGQTISKIANLGVDNFGWHIARHDPARVLRDVAAGRALIKVATEAKEASNTSVGDDYMMAAACLETALKQRAEVYSDHPDYQEAWRV